MKFIRICILLLSLNYISAQDYILVHGWTNTGDLWDNSNVKQLIETLDHDHIYQPSVGGSNGTNSAQSQAAALKNFLNNNSVNNGIAISYSMGGLCTRLYLRNQFEQDQDSKIGYHFSMGTPHLGSKVANNLDKAIQVLVTGAYASIYPGALSVNNNGFIRYTYSGDAYYDFAFLAWVLTGAEPLRYLVYNSGGPALQDLKTTSSAVSYANPGNGNTYEKKVIKVGIVGTEEDPVLWRMSAASIGIPEEQLLEAINYVGNYKFVRIINFLMELEFNNGSFDNLVKEIATYAIFLNINWAWKNLVLETDQSDGIVSKESQEYPHANQILYTDYVSHSEHITHSNNILALEQAISNWGPQKITDSLSVNISGPSILYSSGGAIGMQTQKMEKEMQSKPIDILAPAQSATGTWTANATGGNGTYTYKWFYFASGTGSWYPITWATGKSLTRTIYDNETFKCEVSSAGQTVSASKYVKFFSRGSEPFVSLANTPNPFNPSTKIKISFPFSKKAKLVIYNILGEKIITLYDGFLDAGQHEMEWNGHNQFGTKVASGVYIYSLQTPGKVYNKKMLLVE